MTTVRETVLSALQTLMVTTFGDGTDDDATPSGRFWRDPEKSVDASASGVAVMRDGDPVLLVMTVSPVRYQWEHPAEIEFSAVGPKRKQTVDDMMAALDAALAAGRTLSGAVIDARIVEAPLIQEEESEGAEAVRYASVHVRLEYVSDSPAG